MITGLAVILLTLNLFLMTFFYFKLKSKFSDRASINKIEDEARKLITQIAFHTEQSVTVLEDKIHEVNMLMSELDKRILLAEENDKKRSIADRVYQSLAESAKEELVSSLDRSIHAPASEIPIISEKVISTKIELNDDPTVLNKNSYQTKEAPIKIYTKQILSEKKDITSDIVTPIREQIIEMAKKGFSIEVIAEKVPLPKGEIELIISMNT